MRLPRRSTKERLNSSQSDCVIIIGFFEQK